MKKIAVNSIIFAAALVEGLLALLYLGWVIVGGHSVQQNFPPYSFDLDQGLKAIGYTVPLLVINFALFGVLPLKRREFRYLLRFVEQYILPLALALNWRTAFLVSLLAAFGEELFFRGVLQHEIGVIGASVLFALLHFGTGALKHKCIATIYFCIGLYFSLIYLCSGTLVVPIAVHFLYDYMALLYLKRSVFASQE